jgi:toxin ParE1/3/4
MRYKRAAEADFDNLWFESAKRFGTAQADALLERIDRTLLQTIGSFPSAGRVRPEFGYGVRSYPIVPYLVFYRILGKRVEVLRILHGRRDLKHPLMSLLIAS